MADINEFNNGAGDVVSGVDTVKKGKGGIIAAGVLAGVVAIGAGGGIAAYSLSDFVKNQVKLRISKPESYYAWVTEKNSAEFSSSLSTQYREALESVEKGSKSAVSVKWDISDEAKDYLIEDAFGSDVFDDPDEDVQNVLDVLNDISSAKIGITADSKDTASSGSAYAEVNDNRLLTFEYGSNMDSFNYFFRIPELNEQWLGYEIPEMESDEEVNEILDSYKKMLEDPGSILSPDELEKEIERYVGVWNSSTEEVQIEKKEEVTIGDITVNYTVATVEIDSEKAGDISKSFINSFKEDDILRAVLTDRTGVMTDEEYDSELDDALKELEGDIDSDTKVTVKTYIDPKGDIRGVSFIVIDETYDDTMELCFMTGRDGDQIRGEFFTKENGEEEFRIDLTAVENGKKYTGDIDIMVDDETASIEFTDIETVDEKKGYTNGTVTFIMPDTDPISLTLSSDGSSQKISTEIVVDDMNYGKVTLELAFDEGGAPNVPDKKDAFMVGPETDFELSDYVTEENVNGFLKNMFASVGFDKAESEDLADGITGTLFNTYDYDDFGGWDYDDLDDDWDYDGWDDDDQDDSDDDDDWGDFDFDLDTEPNCAYVYVADKDFGATCFGAYGTLSDGSVDAKIEKNGTYTVSVTADGKVKPNGLTMLCLNIDEMELGGTPEIRITSLKIDGKDIPLTSEPETIIERDYVNVLLYADESLYSLFENSFDGAAIGDWKKIEITFEISGIE